MRRFVNKKPGICRAQIEKVKIGSLELSLELEENPEAACH